MILWSVVCNIIIYILALKDMAGVNARLDEERKQHSQGKIFIKVSQWQSLNMFTAA